MMRGSVVLCAVLGVLSFSIGASNAYYIKSELSDEGISNGNEEAARMGESALGIGENAGDGHYIRKRSLLGLNFVENFGHDMAKLATIRSAAAGTRLMPNSKRQFSSPTPLRVYEGEPVSDMLPAFVPKPRSVSVPINPSDLPLTKPQSIPGILIPMVVRDQVPPLPMLKFLPVTDMTSKAMGVISTLLPPSYLLARGLPKSLIRNSLGSNKNVYIPNHKNLRSKYPDLRNFSYLPAFQAFPPPPIISLLPLLPQARNGLPTYMRAVLDRDELERLSIVQYISKLWDKLHSLFKPSSAPLGDPLSSEGGEFHTEGGPSVGGSPIVGTDIITEGDDVTGGNDLTGGDILTGEYLSEGGRDHDYEEYHTHTSHSNWEDRRLNDYGEHYDRAYYPNWEARRLNDYGEHYDQTYYPNWEARHPSEVENGIGDVTSTIEDTTGVANPSYLLNFFKKLLNTFERLTYRQ